MLTLWFLCFGEMQVSIHAGFCIGFPGGSHVRSDIFVPGLIILHEVTHLLVAKSVQLDGLLQQNTSKASQLRSLYQFMHAMLQLLKAPADTPTQRLPLLSEKARQKHSACQQPSPKICSTETCSLPELPFTFHIQCCRNSLGNISILRSVHEVCSRIFFLKVY